MLSKIRNIQVAHFIPLIKGIKPTFSAFAIDSKKNNSSISEINTTSISDSSNKEEKAIEIWTDGSLKNKSGRMGIGIYLGEEHELNCSHAANHDSPDSNRAEIIAVINALMKLLSWKGYKNQDVVIYSDSEQIHLWFLDLVDPKVCELEFDYLRKLFNVYNINGINVKIVWVKGHSENEGNKKADCLARRAAKCNNKNFLWSDMSPEHSNIHKTYDSLIAQMFSTSTDTFW